MHPSKSQFPSKTDILLRVKKLLLYICPAPILLINSKFVNPTISVLNWNGIGKVMYLYWPAVSSKGNISLIMVISVLSFCQEYIWIIVSFNKMQAPIVSSPSELRPSQSNPTAKELISIIDG